MPGFLKVFTGPMFSGKTTRLIEEANTYKVRGYDVKVFAPKLKGVEIKSRNGSTLECKSLETNLDYYALRDTFLDNGAITRRTVIVLEEAQFFGKNLAAAIRAAQSHGISFLVSGLSTDFMGRPFGDFPMLLCLADEIVSLKAVCCKCKQQNATRTIRTTEEQDTILIGSDMYEAICPECA